MQLHTQNGVSLTVPVPENSFPVDHDLDNRSGHSNSSSFFLRSLRKMDKIQEGTYGRAARR